VNNLGSSRDLFVKPSSGHAFAANLARVHDAATTVATNEDRVMLARGELRLAVTLRPLRFTLARRGRSLLKEAEAWVADGHAADHFMKLTEGVIPSEKLAPRERASRAAVSAEDENHIELDVVMRAGRAARLRIGLPDNDLVSIELEAEDAPLRLALEWDRNAEERLVGLGARHIPQLDHAGRSIQLGADRRYTGPDCPPDLLESGGIPQGDCAPVPWLLSSRGYGVLVDSEANGVKFDLTERTAVSTRATAGPLRVFLMCAPTPAARVRQLCRQSGFPELLPEWGYGFWKSRDVYEHQDDVLDDFRGFTSRGIPLDAIVIDSPWETQYNTWKFNPHQFPDARRMISEMRAAGVRTVVWVTPWVNLDSRDGQVPPQPASERLHTEPASNYAPGAAAGHFVRDGEGEPFVAEWWMGTGSPVDLTSPDAEAWWRAQAKQVLELGVEGIKADDGEGYYIPDHVRFADGRSGAQAAWALGGLHRRCLQRALDEVHPGRGVLFGRSGWTGQHAIGHTWGGDQASDFWSLRALVAATLGAACSGVSNWSHDVGGYLGHRLVERCPPELLVRWVQFGCFTPLMHAHGRMPQEPWHYSERVLDLYRGYVLLHEQLVPYVRAAAATAARAGLPIVRPLCLVDAADDRGWRVADAYGYGPSLWVAPVLEDGSRERPVPLPRGRWIETWSGRVVDGGREVVVETPLELIPVWARAGSLIVCYPAEHVAAGLGDTLEDERPLEATLWGAPPLGRASARLADGTRVSWRGGEWSVTRERRCSFREVATD
jgi:alpha-glucosidase (family GH31 glycosyl hydrolase)